MAVREAPADNVASKAHLQWIRGCRCVMADFSECQGQVQAHHVRQAERYRDDMTLPVCAGHHQEIHNTGHDSIEKATGLNMAKVADAHWMASPAGKKYRSQR